MIRRAYVDTRFGQVHCRTHGPRIAPPLVLFHQTASTSEMYEALMVELGDAYFCVAPDTPGFGQSFAPSEEASVPCWTEALAEALGRIEVTRAFVFGHHTGASIAVQLETDRPGFARKLALSGPPYLDDVQRAALGRATPIPLDADGQHLLAVWRTLRAKDPAAPLALTQRETLSTLQVGARHADAYRAVANQDFNAQLARLGCPLLLLCGDEDSLRSSFDAAAATTPTARTARIAGVGTYLCDRKPRELAVQLRGFFDPA